MHKLLLQLDSSRLPSVFDRVVAYDGGADEVMSYGGVVEADVRDLIHGCIFTRGPKDLKNTAVFVGGADIAVGEQLLAAATKAMFKPFTVSAMLDSNGSNTTAVAAVAQMVQAAGGDSRRRAVRQGGRGRVHHVAQGRGGRAGSRSRAQAVRREGARHRDGGRERGRPRVRARGAAAQRRPRGSDAGPEARVGQPARTQGRGGRERGSPARHRGGGGDGRWRDERRRGVPGCTRHRKP